jgi:hypothetical protein
MKGDEFDLPEVDLTGLSPDAPTSFEFVDATGQLKTTSINPWVPPPVEPGVVSMGLGPLSAFGPLSAGDTLYDAAEFVAQNGQGLLTRARRAMSNGARQLRHVAGEVWRRYLS